MEGKGVINSPNETTNKNICNEINIVWLKLLMTMKQFMKIDGAHTKHKLLCDGC